ncbi:PHP domain-containing protein [Ktedonospora formicarum]|uniref:Phosphotransferase n=1 Tax=Ktedonospora formicarum TaxID=2778364 RepID=A0A8J3I0W5_9CHLR|nr:PHP domain-containing protein [Ktedonospora formicarum]GHO42864.1 phosphotransferase [Ktedonospora formicarum]
MDTLTHGLRLAPGDAIDLQMHTTFSDGKWTPEQLIDYLANERFGLVAITDHEGTVSTARLQQLGHERNLPVLAAAEMSGLWRGQFVDILCYGFDPAHNELQAIAEQITTRQQDNIRQAYQSLQRQGFSFPHQKEVLAHNQGKVRTMDDIIDLLEKHGYATDPETPYRLLDETGFHFATHDATRIVEAAHRSDAIAILAHPGRGEPWAIFDEPTLDQFRAEVPIDGLEAHYTTHTPEQTAMFLAYAQKHHLLTSSGSDSHGPNRKPIKYPASYSRALLERLGIQVH